MGCLLIGLKIKLQPGRRGGAHDGKQYIFVYVVDVISIVVDLVISIPGELKNVTPASGFDMDWPRKKMVKN